MISPCPIIFSCSSYFWSFVTNNKKSITIKVQVNRILEDILSFNQFLFLLVMWPVSAFLYHLLKETLPIYLATLIYYCSNGRIGEIKVTTSLNFLPIKCLWKKRKIETWFPCSHFNLCHMPMKICLITYIIRGHNLIDYFIKRDYFEKLNCY